MPTHSVEGGYYRESDGKEFTYKGAFTDGLRPTWSAKVYRDGAFVGEPNGVILTQDIKANAGLGSAVKALVENSIKLGVGIDS